MQITFGDILFSFTILFHIINLLPQQKIDENKLIGASELLEYILIVTIKSEIDFLSLAFKVSPKC
jgi:hypothetical protein